MQIKYAVLVNYCHDPQDWWREYDIEALMYDRSDDGIQYKFDANVKRTPNIGNVDYDKLSYLVDYYDDLPEIFLWSKSNIFKYCDKKTLEKALAKGEFTPLIRPDHKTYSDRHGVVCYYQDGWYYERADSWFFNSPELHNNGHYKHWWDWVDAFGLPRTEFIPFAPGGNYLLTRERVHRYSKDFYEKMRDTLPYSRLPLEAHCAERSYGLLWK